MFSDIHIDLRDAAVSGTEADITMFHILSHVKLVVPEGVEVELTGFVIFGDRELSLAPVPQLPGIPVLHIRVTGLLGDVTVTSQSRKGVSQCVESGRVRSCVADPRRGHRGYHDA